MTPQHNLRRPDQPIQIGPCHGYRVEGDHVVINAEIQVPPYHSGGEWALQLWAADQPYQEGALTGVKVAELPLDLPTPIGPYLHQVDARTAAHLPPQGRPYAMVLALVQHGPEGQTSVPAFANYPKAQTFSAPHFAGKVGYQVEGTEVLLHADGIFNPRPRANLSGTLAVELWAFPVSGSTTGGLRLAIAEIEPIAGESQLSAIERRVAFVQPPEGRFQLALLLCEWTLAHGYLARDRRNFSCLYEGPPPEISAAPGASAPAACVVAVRPVERLRLVPTVEPAPLAAPKTATEVKGAEPATAAVVDEKPAAPGHPAAAEGLVSIQTGTAEELARVKGLNLKIAKDIITARPFSSVADLIRVRGLGKKTVDKLKGLVTL